MNAVNVESRRRYIWPWYLLAAVIVGIIISVLAVMHEARRVARMKDAAFDPNVTLPPTGTNYLPPSATTLPGSGGSASPSSTNATNGMVWVPGGTFWMGASDGQRDEMPAHEII